MAQLFKPPVNYRNNDALPFIGPQFSYSVINLLTPPCARNIETSQSTFSHIPPFIPLH